MKILLVQPVKEKKHVLNLMPHLGLGYLATSLRKKFSVQILDCVKENFNFDDFSTFVKKSQPDVVGFTMFSCDSESVKQCIDIVKHINPNIVTVVGGPHPSGDPCGTLEYLPETDFAFKGEAETSFPLLIDLLRNGNNTDEKTFSTIPGLIWEKDNTIVCNSPKFSDDMDSLGFPSWDLIMPHTYKGVPNGVFLKQSPFAPIITTRGCPYACTFCAGHNVTGKKIRKRTVEHIIEEIKMLHLKYGIREIHIEDDNFTFDNDFAKKVCEEIIRLNYPLTFSCPNGVRLDRVDRELLELMKRAGWYIIFVGIESGSDRILKHMKKSLKKEQIREKVSLIREVGLEASGYFILGYPEETKDDIYETIQFSRSLDLNWAQFATFIPIPGSEIMNSKQFQMLNETTNLRNYFNTDVPYSPLGISKEELKKLQKKAFFYFYIRPKVIWQLIKKIRRDNFRLIARRCFAYLFN